MLRPWAGGLALSLLVGLLPAFADSLDPSPTGLALDRVFDRTPATGGDLRLRVFGSSSDAPPPFVTSGMQPPTALPALDVDVKAPSAPAVSLQALHLDVAAPLPFLAQAPALWQAARGTALPEFFGLGATVASDAPFDPSLASALGTRSVQPSLAVTGPFTQPVSGQSFTYTTPARIAAARFVGRLFGAHLEELQPDPNPPASFGTQLPSSVRASRDVLGGGAAFAVPVFGARMGINLSAGVDHVQRADRTVAAYTPFDANVSALARSALSYEASAGNGVYAESTPNFFDVYRLRMGAGATLPVSHDVVFGAAYGTQEYHGTAGTSLTPNVAERKDQVDLTVTYNVPRTTGAVLFSFHNNVYRDLTGSLANFNFTQNREDLTFTIRF